jgi:V8-like Glu-specific endopeptidase
MVRSRERNLLLAFTTRAGLAAIAAISCDRAVNAAESELLRPFIPAVSMDKDRRLLPEVFARQAAQQQPDLRRQLGATGLVRCGAATGTGQLTVRNNVITTAAHVLIDQHGKRRVGCVFEPTIAGGGSVSIDYASIVTGSKRPLAERATRDWAVARLVAPVHGVKPYGLGTVGSQPTAIMLCAGGNQSHSAMGTEQCSTRRVIGAASDGIRELAIDCTAGPGSSGGALIAGNKVVGIYIGYRSNNPTRAQSFSDSHYNFAITVDGPFRRALMSAVGH